MKKISILSLILTGIFVCTAFDASACSGCAKEPVKNECKVSKLKSFAKSFWDNKDYLGLTDEQMTKLKEIKHAALKDLIRLNAEVEIAEIDFKSEMWEPLVNVEKINGIVDQKFAVKTKMAKTFIQAVADMQQVLSEDQRVKALKLAKKGKKSGECGKSMSKSGCGKCAGKSADCGKCSGAAGGPKVCPITGKALK
ncbi:MAG: Spy/CpxP family protein refolding chaperone [Candidatus Omnitrophota bacterium]